jgi:polyisoprenoid-binding protein YceI
MTGGTKNRTRTGLKGLIAGGAVLAAALAGAGLLTAGPWGVAAPAAARDQGARAGAFEVDPVHSSVVFGVGHLGVARFWGVFPASSGSYNIDPADLSSSFIDISISTEKVFTGNEGRDKHLRSPDFFNAQQFPTITFRAGSFEKTGEKTMRVTGELTMLDTTRPVTAEVEYFGAGETRQGFKSGSEARFTIRRSEFGMTKYLEGNAIGDEVHLIAGFEGVRK